MAPVAERVLDEALQLTPEERLHLAQELHQSVLSAEEREIQQEWIAVAEQRYDDWKAGRATTRPAEDVLDELLVKYAPHRRDPRRS
jgi:putative addiction module component (TIGR02574 family)